MAERAPSLANVMEAIGGLKANVENIQGDIKSAELARAEIYRGMELLGQQMIRVDNSVKQVTDDVAEMKPAVADYRKIRANVNGGLLVLGGIGAVIFTAIGFVMKDIWNWLVAHIRFG